MKYLILLIVMIAGCDISEGSSDPITNVVKPKRPLIMFTDDGTPLTVIQEAPAAKGDYVKILNEKDDSLNKKELDESWKYMCVNFCQYNKDGELK